MQVTEGTVITWAVYSLVRRSQQVMRLLCGYVTATHFYAYAATGPLGA